jgi:hypothetical protein
MSRKDKERLELLEFGVELKRTANKAIEKVRQENKKMGIPLVYSKNDIIYYEMPNGKIVTNYKFD